MINTPDQSGAYPPVVRFACQWWAWRSTPNSPATGIHGMIRLMTTMSSALYARPQGRKPQSKPSAGAFGALVTGRSPLADGVVIRFLRILPYDGLPQVTPVLAPTWARCGISAIGVLMTLSLRA